MKLIIDIDENVRIAISRMGLLRIPDEMQKEVDRAIQRGKPLEQEPCDVFDKYGNYKYPCDVELTEPNIATSMPCDDVVSREDALNSLIENTDFEGWELSQALKAIEDLPSVTQKPIECDDVVSRQAVQTELKNCEVVDMYDENDNIVGYYNADTVDSIVRNLPLVRPQEQTGHWILTMPKGSEEWAYKCSRCGFYKYRKTIDLSKFAYCPNCKAIMQESEE